MDGKQDAKDTAALGEEPDTSRSLAATLRLAASKGYIDKNQTKQQTVRVSSAKKAKLEARSYTIEEKREEKREYHHKRQRLQEVREPVDEYKPEISLEYTDDTGRKLETPKEAFRYLCHKFHGKGPGKNKIDKRLRKQELESKSKSFSSIEEPSSSASLMISKQKELKSPYIVLSKGK